MRKLLFSLFFLLLALFLGHWIQKDPGYVLLIYQNISVETTLWFGILCLLLAFILLYFFVRLYRNTAQIPIRFSRWGRRRQHRRAKNLTNQGLCDLAEGYWRNAEKTLIKAAKAEPAPLINYLAAAQAAHSQKAYARRDEYLRLAHHSTEDSEIAVGLTQASLQISSRQWEQALATLTHIKKSAPNHPHIIKLLKRVYTELKDWKQLQALLSDLKRFRVIDSSALEQLEKKTALTIFKNSLSSITTETAKDTWQQLDRCWRIDADFVSPFAEKLHTLGETAFAEEVLTHALKKQWAPQLVTHYAALQLSDTIQQLQRVEPWLKAHANAPEVLLAACQLSLKAGFPGKAKDYIDDCLKLAPTADAYCMQGQVFEASGDKEKALGAYRAALEI